jgi:hypothetical protein
MSIAKTISKHRGDVEVDVKNCGDGNSLVGFKLSPKKIMSSEDLNRIEEIKE